MQRQKDITASEVIGFADDNGNIAEVQVNGATTDGEQTWILLHTTDATFRMSTADDNEECILTGLDIYAPESLLSEGMPEGLTSMTLSRGSYTDALSITGTRRAIRDFVRDNWTDGSDDADEQLAAWMNLVVTVADVKEWE